MKFLFFTLLALSSCKSTNRVSSSPSDISASKAEKNCLCRYNAGYCLLYRPGSKQVMHTKDAQGKLIDQSAKKMEQKECNADFCSDKWGRDFINVPLDPSNNERPGCGGSWRYVDPIGTKPKDKAENGKLPSTKCVCQRKFDKTTFDSTCEISVRGQKSPIAKSFTDCTPNYCKNGMGRWGQVQSRCWDKGQFNFEYIDDLEKQKGCVCRKVGISSSANSSTLFCLLSDKSGGELEKSYATSGSCKNSCDAMVKKHEAKCK